MIFKKKEDIPKHLLILSESNFDIHHIKASYRKLAKELHPDTSKGNSEGFKLLSDSYQFLKDYISNQETYKSFKSIYPKSNLAQFSYLLFQVQPNLIDLYKVKERYTTLSSLPLSTSSQELLNSCFTYIYAKYKEQHTKYYLPDRVF